jgi:holo-[acyl-carrier protein] synthase
MTEKSPKISVGVDIIEIGRIEQAVSSWHGSFLKRIYTEAELATSKNDPSSLAARFAAKEAVMKALGTGAMGIGWKDIEILCNSDGAPFVRLYGRACDKAREIGVSQFSLSMSHSKQYAVAMVVGYAA